MRWRAQTDGTWWARPQDLQFGGSGVLGRALGDRSWSLVVSRSQRARRHWASCLDEYQSHPLLSQARSAELEQELQALVFRRPGASARHADGRKPLGLSVLPLKECAPLTAEDKTVIAEVTDRHLLPRFDLSSVAALAAYDDSPGRRRVAAGARYRGRLVRGGGRGMRWQAVGAPGDLDRGRLLSADRRSGCCGSAAGGRRLGCCGCRPRRLSG